MGTRSPRVEAVVQRRSYDLYIVTGDEIPFEDDGLRDGECVRHWMHQRLIARLTEEDKRFIVVTGSQEERLTKAISEIDAL